VRFFVSTASPVCYHGDSLKRLFAINLNRLNPKKLLNSKWTSISPSHKEKHFLIIDVELNEEDQVVDCVIEAIMTKRTESIDWRLLKDPKSWLQGWR